MERRAIIIHCLDDARSALAAARRAGVPAILMSAPAAAGYAGAGWFAALAGAAASEFPDVRFEAVLDCGGRAGVVMGALRQGVKSVRFAGDAASAAKLADLAQAMGAALIVGPLPARDLRGARDPEAAALAWLTETAA